MTPHTLALEACRLLVEAYNTNVAHDPVKLREARIMARRALAEAATTHHDDTRTLNIGGGR